MAKAIKEHQLLETVLSAKFQDWVIGGVRQKSLLRTIGWRSVFAVNGKEWQTARALIRPSFTRN
ncbi:hypothetical protein ACRE_063890 [Hapsidospora chrysogenum ATCC 11550]|uniref:Uncharacterized protein n=1 Tax=Hapsidospora chrysogenum (strain ATCC 11550 / CBS 779.69 / DSM 880 / IAM 14645 / JCM 23072 / IMI 49137) TaxID=857340 RepID=A0A086T0H2_HAPC1|nr:hypothetical protein ACRE_063890 [Hapsidospora chrysogenum ATCC 11550]